MTAERSETDATKEHPKGEREGRRERVKIIGVAHEEDAPFHPGLHFTLEPFFEHSMQIDVAQQWTAERSETASR